MNEMSVNEFYGLSSMISILTFGLASVQGCWTDILRDWKSTGITASILQKR